jgi:hypothetical protein
MYMWFVWPGTTSCVPASSGGQNEWITEFPSDAGAAPSGGPG